MNWLRLSSYYEDYKPIKTLFRPKISGDYTKSSRYTVGNMLRLASLKFASVNYWRPIGIAASVLLVALLIGFLLRNSVPDETVVATQYGETQEFTLPDGTEVFLNANSTLRYSADETPREVWLEGEAYFQVVKQKNGLTKRADDFRVHTQNLTVRVLGTRFVVDSRKEQVVLDEGKVEVQPRTDGQSHLSLAPGRNGGT